MGANSKFHKIIGAAEIVVGAVLDYYSFGTLGNSLILVGLATFEGVPGAPAPTPNAQNLTLTSAITPLQILYGRCKVSGLLVAADSGDGGGSTAADYKYLAVAHSLTIKTGSTSALALQGRDAAGSYYLDDNPIFTACVDPSTGDVSGSGSQGNLIDYDGIVQIKTYLGNQTAVDPWLTAGLSYWTSTAIGYGVAYTVVKIHADPTSDAVQAAFPGGLPQQIAVEMFGSKVYDPRLDSSVGGSGSQRKTNTATWTYSTNPALCLRDYLTRPTTEGGAGIASAAIPDDFLMAAANRCDEALTIPSGHGGTTTTTRFSCAVGLVTSDSIPTNIQKLLDSMAGWIVATGGELRIFAGEYVAPVTTITADWLCGSPTFQTTAEQDQRWNTVNATFTDPESAWSTVQTPSFAESGAVAADGGSVITKNLNLPAVSDQYNAQYICQISAKQSREQKVLTLPCNLMALDVDCGEVVEVTIPEYNLSSATFRVTNWQRKGDSSILLTLQQANSNTFDDETFNEVSPLGQPALVDQVPPVPTNLTAVGKVGGIALNWDDLPASVFASYEVWRSTSSGGSYSLVQRPTTSAWEDPIIGAAVTYYYKVRAKSYRGKYSAYTSPVSATSINVTDVVGGTGPNLMPTRYSMFTTTNAKLPVFADHTSLSYQKATSTTAYGYLALQLDCTSGSVPPILALVADKSAPNIALNNKRYGVQVWMSPFGGSSDFNTFNFSFYNTGGTLACPSVAAAIVPGTATHVKAAILDMTGAADTDVYLQLDWPSVVGNGHIADIQGFAIFELQGTSSVVPDFEPSAPASHDDLADGVTFAGVLQTAMPSGSNQLDLSRAAQDTGTGEEGIINADTQYLADGAGLGATADLTQTTNLPPTVAQAVALGMVTDAQVAVPPAAGTGYILKMDGGGAIYTAPQYDSNVNNGVDNPSSVTTSSTSMVLVTDLLGFINPGQAVNIEAEMTGVITNGSATGLTAAWELEYSLDSGSTWTAGPTMRGSIPATNSYQIPIAASISVPNLTATGDILFRVRGDNNTATSITFQAITLRARFYPVSNFYTLSPLAASVATTAALSCTGIYPATTCAGSCNVKVLIPSGKAPFSPSWTKVSGTGTLSGSTSITATVSDTETTADGGATHTTTVNCTVTDSQSYTVSSGSESGTTASLVLNALHNIPVGAKFDVSGCTPSGYNGTGLTALSGTTGSTAKYTTGSGLGAITVGGTLTNVRVTTGNCVITGTFTRSYSAVSNSITGTKIANCYGTSGTCTAGTTLTNNPSGGDKSYTYSNIKTAGSFTLSGSTSKSFSVSESGSCAGSGSSDTGTAKGTITDGHSNTGNATTLIDFNFNNIGT